MAGRPVGLASTRDARPTTQGGTGTLHTWVEPGLDSANQSDTTHANITTPSSWFTRVYVLPDTATFFADRVDHTPTCVADTTSNTTVTS